MDKITESRENRSEDDLVSRCVVEHLEDSVVGVGARVFFDTLCHPPPLSLSLTLSLSISLAHSRSLSLGLENRVVDPPTEARLLFDAFYRSASLAFTFALSRSLSLPRPLST